MRTVAQYAFTRTAIDRTIAESLYEQSIRAVEAWLREKGVVNTGAGTLEFQDGRMADLETAHWKSQLGTAVRWKLSESNGPTRFSTTLALANADAEVAFTCNLSTGSTATAIAPRPFTARCPGIVKEIIKFAPGWRIGETVVPVAVRKLSGSSQAKDLVKELLSPSRALPIVVASRFEGFLLHPNLADLLASDICGLGIVTDLNDDTAWEMTKLIGKEWSCYNGAIRIYWPHLETTPQPSHRKWRKSVGLTV